MSYTKQLKPWGWVIGTGIYINKVDDDMRAVQIAAGIGLLSLLVLSILLALLISRTITRPIKEVVDSIKDIAQGEGDLTKRLAIRGDNEVVELCVWFNSFVDKIHGIISQVSGSALQLASSACSLPPRRCRKASPIFPRNRPRWQRPAMRCRLPLRRLPAF